MSNGKVCIIGGGIMGLSCAEALLQKGFDVTILDRPAKTPGCSFGNGGLIVPSHFEPLATPSLLRTGLRMILRKDSPFGLGKGLRLRDLGWIARFALAANKGHVERSAPLLRDLHLASRDLYAFMSEWVGFDFGYQRHGLLMVCNSEEDFVHEQEVARLADKLGLAAQIFDGKALNEGQFGATIKAAGGVYFEDDAQLVPAVFMSGFKSYLLGRGMHFEEAEVISFDTQSNRLVSARTGSGETSADEFVLCAGVWSTSLARLLGVNLPMLSGKGCGFSAPGALPGLKSPLILSNARVAVTPYKSETRFVGLMELGAPGTSCSTGRVRNMQRAICETLPEVPSGQLESLPVWVGNRPCTPDGLPVIGRTRKWQNLTLATGHAMMGMSLGPITGKLVSQILYGENPEIEALSPNRF